jgi:RNA polymerase sigma-70 factor (ECF subfamily)
MPQDRELVERCLSGEAEAFHGLVEVYREPLYRVVYRFLGNHHDALEAAQEAFARAFEKLGTYDVEQPFSTWLFSIAANFSRDLLRKRGRRRLVVDEEAVRGVPGGDGPEGEAERSEEAERLRRAVDELDDDKRLAVVLRYFEGKSMKEIAEITGTAVNTLKVRLFRARRELFARLDGRP